MPCLNFGGQLLISLTECRKSHFEHILFLEHYIVSTYCYTHPSKEHRLYYRFRLSSIYLYRWVNLSSRLISCHQNNNNTYPIYHHYYLAHKTSKQVYHHEGYIYDDTIASPFPCHSPPPAALPKHTTILTGCSPVVLFQTDPTETENN